MRVVFISCCLALAGMSALCRAHDLSDAEMLPITMAGCELTISDAAAPGMIAGCTRVIDANQLSSRQLSYAHYVRGNLFIMIREKEKGRVDIDRAIELNPADGAAYETRGVEYKFETPENAARDFQKALDLGYTYGTAAQDLASLRAECPSMVFKDHVCQSAASAQQSAAAVPMTAPTQPAPATAAAESRPCEPGIFVNILAVIRSVRPPPETGYPWTLALIEQRGGCKLELIQTDGKPPPACIDDATVSASGKVFDQTLINPGDLRCTPEGQSHQSAGWFDWLWGKKEPAVEPQPLEPKVTAAPPPAASPPPPISPQQTTQAPPASTPVAAPSTSTTTKANYLGKEVEVALPSGFCLADADDAIIARVVELKAKQFPVLVLTGIKDCDVAKGTFRNRYGIAFGFNDPRLTTPDATVRENMKTYTSDMCLDLKMSSMGNGFPVGALSTLGPDASQVEVINANAAAMLQGPHEAAIRNLGMLGLRNDVCYSAELWMTSDGKVRKAMFGVFAMMVIKERPVVLMVYEQIVSADTARQLTDRVAAAADRMRELNGAGR